MLKLCSISIRLMHVYGALWSVWSTRRNICCSIT